MNSKLPTYANWFHGRTLLLIIWGAENFRHGGIIWESVLWINGTLNNYESVHKYVRENGNKAFGDRIGFRFRTALSPFGRRVNTTADISRAFVEELVTEAKSETMAVLESAFEQDQWFFSESSASKFQFCRDSSSVLRLVVADLIDGLESSLDASLPAESVDACLVWKLSQWPIVAKSFAGTNILNEAVAGWINAKYLFADATLSEIIINPYVHVQELSTLDKDIYLSDNLVTQQPRLVKLVQVIDDIHKSLRHDKCT